MTGACAATRLNPPGALATRVCQRDAAAFRLVFARSSRPGISFIFDMVNDRPLAEELTQETFVRAFRAIHTMRPETKLSTWLFGIAKNVAREALRTRARAGNHVDLSDKSVMYLSDNKPVPVDGVLNKELNEVIQRSLAALDEDKRLVFTLKVLHQYSYEEIAEITGFSLAKLKTDLHRARAEMRKRISPYAGVGYEV
jgi:RNA polymerase sigma-70 factor (ECF subfamily)